MANTPTATRMVTSTRAYAKLLSASDVPRRGAQPRAEARRESRCLPAPKASFVGEQGQIDLAPAPRGVRGGEARVAQLPTFWDSRRVFHLLRPVLVTRRGGRARLRPELPY